MYREALKRSIKKPILLQERSDQSILIVETMIMGWVVDTAKVIGASANPTYCAYNKGNALFLSEEASLAKFTEEGIKRVREDLTFVKKLIRRFRVEIKKLNDFTQDLYDRDLAKLTNRQLFDLFEQYHWLYRKAFGLGEPISWPLRFDFVKELEKRLTLKLGDKGRLNDCLSTLITPDEPSFVSKEEAAFLELTIKFIRNPDITALFRESIPVIDKKLSSRFPEYDRMLNAHVDRYCWIPSDYESAAWDRQHFIGMLKQLLKGTSDPVRKLEALKTQPASLRKKKDRIIKELDLDQETVKLFEAVADAGYLLDYKKERFTLSHYHMRHWIEEAAKRLNISIRQLRYMTMDEVKAALVNNRIDTAELDERYNYCVVIVDENGAEFYYKDEAKEMFRLFQPTVDGDKTEIQGTCAQAGTVRGYARVMLSSRDQSKMQDGEVLITTMTTPDFVPAMKKAKAIITDEGGITCHAAIVSRELGTPCVVGTKIATRFFRTGDLVEIHAASGIVRKMG